MCAFGYADDLTLLCPSLRGMQSMQNVCQHFGLECDVKFNRMTSECIVFSRDRKQVNFNLYLDGEIIKHLGSTPMCDVDEGTELKRKLSEFTYRVNSLRATYREM